MSGPVEKPCPVCLGPVERPETGRPPTFCSPGCRRAAEYALRRLERWLDRLQERRLDAAIAAASAPPDPMGRRRKASGRKVLQLIDAEIVRSEERLRQLLGRFASPAIQEEP